MKRLLAMLLLPMALAATAQEAPGEQPSALQMVGEARLKFLFWSVYDSRLTRPMATTRPGSGRYGWISST